MAILNITAPDGKSLKINVPQGTDPSQYDTIVEEVVADYVASHPSAATASTLGPELKGDLAPSTSSSDVTDQGNVVTNPVSKLGTSVEAGYAGIGDLATGKGLPQAADTVHKVLDEKPVETTSGKVGKFAGSFFTPTQIALQATGAKLAAPIVKGLGKGANAVGNLLARSSEVEIPAAQKAAGGVIGALTDVAPEHIEQVIANAPGVAAAKGFPALAEDVATAVNRLSDHIGTLDTVANATLSAEKILPTKPVLDAISTAYKGLGNAALPEVQAAQDTLKAMATAIEARGGSIPENELAQWIKSLQSGINWNDPTGTVRNKALSKIQGIANDALKAGNPEYAKAEGDLASAINLKGRIADAMGIVREPGQEWQAKNVAVTKLKQLMHPDNVSATKKLLKEFSEVPGVPNFIKEAQLAAAKEAINAPATGAHKMFGLGTRLPALGGVLAGLVPPTAEVVTSGVPYVTQGAPLAANAVYQGLKK